MYLLIHLLIAAFFTVQVKANGDAISVGGTYVSDSTCMAYQEILNLTCEAYTTPVKAASKTAIASSVITAGTSAAIITTTQVLLPSASNSIPSIAVSTSSSNSSRTDTNNNATPTESATGGSSAGIANNSSSSSSSGNSSNSNKVGIIVGCVCGVLALVSTGLAFLFYYKMKKRRAQQKEHEEEAISNKTRYSEETEINRDIYSPTNFDTDPPPVGFTAIEVKPVESTVKPDVEHHVEKPNAFQNNG